MLDLAMSPAAQARAEIKLMMQDPEIAKRWADGDPAILAKVKGLHEHEYKHSRGAEISGAPSLAEQLNVQADSLAAAGAPPDVVQHFREGLPVTASERQQANALWDSRKKDPEWCARVKRDDFQAKQELLLMQAIRSSPVVP
jgi:hypothetical protein